MGSVCSLMGSGASVAEKRYLAEQEERARQIDREIVSEKKQKVLKLLLLGPGESGKSTTLKQIREPEQQNSLRFILFLMLVPQSESPVLQKIVNEIIHDQGFSADERGSKKGIIFSNLICGMVELIRILQERGVPYQNPESEKYAAFITEYYDLNKQTAMQLPDDLADAISSLSMDLTVQQALHRASDINVDESAKFFLGELERIRQIDYIPSEEDMLKCRVPTSGVVQFHFVIKSYIFKVFDVGGQKAQRRKWIHIFDDVHAVLFITSLAEYNQVLAEDSKVNRMRDSIELFDQICNNEWFTNTAMILFLNKIDLFEEKIKLYPITIALKNYKGKQEYRPSLDYITRKFKQMNKNAKRTIYIHETCATDTKQIQVVIDSVIDVVIQQTMQKVGIQ